MATEEYNNQEDTNDSGGDSGSGGGGTVTLSQTDGAFTKYIEDVLDDAIEAAKSTKNVNCTVKNQKATIRLYKTCSLLQAGDALEEYTNISNCITTTLSQGALELQADISSYITKAGAMESALQTAMAAVKAAKTKISEVKTAACKLENAMTDTCNSEQMRVLSLRIVADSDTGEKNFADTVEDIMDAVDHANNCAYEAFESGIKVSGIMQFTNVESLKSFGDGLKGYVDALHADVQGNITKAASNQTAAQTALTTALQELTTATFQKNHVLSLHNGLVGTREYVADPTAPMNDLNTISEKVEQTFENPASC